MKKIFSLALCLVGAFTFSAFDWGWGSKSKEEPKSQTQSTWQTPSGQTVTTSSKATANKAASKTNAKGGPSDQVPSAASDKAAAISTLAKIVGTGTPAERQARIESLKRVSQALAQSQAQAQTPAKNRR
jgi:hypothetical protein